MRFATIAYVAIYVLGNKSVHILGMGGFTTSAYVALCVLGIQWLQHL